MVFVLENPEFENILEQEEIIFVIPEEEIKEEEIEEKKQKLRLSGFRNHTKYHKELISINRLKNKIDANLYRPRIYS